MINEYKLLLEEYDELATTATDISTRSADRVGESPCGLAASQLFTNLGLRFISLMRFLPQSRLHDARFETWDTESIAALVGTIVEAAHAFDYLVVDEHFGCRADKFRSINKWLSNYGSPAI